ncbi:GM21735 [Drosophila sechellia]|uniref:GM21735 n=1 Tax=Drosophila sechellia TaxID=7238 RepID=B4IJZ3_DROSE|nr:GM21735 [Drosophila sechellia]
MTLQCPKKNQKVWQRQDRRLMDTSEQFASPSAYPGTYPYPYPYPYFYHYSKPYPYSQPISLAIHLHMLRLTQPIVHHRHPIITFIILVVVGT